jgi:hypothetical protein
MNLLTYATQRWGSRDPRTVDVAAHLFDRTTREPIWIFDSDVWTEVVSAYAYWKNVPPDRLWGPVAAEMSKSREMWTPDARDFRVWLNARSRVTESP